MPGALPQGQLEIASIAPPRRIESAATDAPGITKYDEGSVSHVDGHLVVNHPFIPYCACAIHDAKVESPHLDADRNVAASAAIMHGDPAPMRKVLDELLRDA